MPDRIELELSVVCHAETIMISEINIIKSSYRRPASGYEQVRVVLPELNIFSYPERVLWNEFSPALLSRNSLTYIGGTDLWFPRIPVSLLQN